MGPSGPMNKTDLSPAINPTLLALHQIYHAAPAMCHIFLAGFLGIRMAHIIAKSFDTRQNMDLDISAGQLKECGLRTFG